MTDDKSVVLQRWLRAQIDFIGGIEDDVCATEAMTSLLRTTEFLLEADRIWTEGEHNLGGNCGFAFGVIFRDSRNAQSTRAVEWTVHS